LNASREVVVVPTGTFRVAGRVVESDGAFPISEARIEARNSSGTGPATESDGSGFFKLFGVTADAEIVVSRSGYVASARRVALDSHSTVNFEMTFDGPRPEFSGTYSVTLDLTECRDGFRQEYARRVYTAVVQQSGSRVDVRFTEPAFAVNSANLGNLMRGFVQGTGLSLHAELPYYYYYAGPGSYPSLVEALPDDSRLVVSGSATLLASGGSYTGKMRGWAGNYGPRYPNDKYLGGCSTGQLTFTRR
jgi:Carboxypeptidase regulatory-like domain